MDVQHLQIVRFGARVDISRRVLAFGLLMLLTCFLYFNRLTGQTIKLLEINEEGKEMTAADVYVVFKCLSTGKTVSMFTNDQGVVINPFTLPTVIKISPMAGEPLIDTLRHLQARTFKLKSSAVHLPTQVITGQYGPQAEEHKSVYSIRIIDRMRIDRQAAVNLRDLFSAELNVRITQDQQLGANISMGGIGGQNIKILIDGVPVIGRMDGNIDLTQLNLNNIERIEVVQGPMSVNYGTDALGGVINLITRKINHTKPVLALNTFYETAGHYNLDGRCAMRFGKYRFSISGGRNFFEGWSPDVVDRTRLWKPREQWFGDVRTERTFGKWNVRYTGSAFRELITNRGLPTITPYSATAFDELFYTTRLNNVVNVNGVIENNRYLDFLVAHNYFRRTKATFINDLVELRQTLTPNAEQQDTSTFNHVLLRGTYSMNKPETRFNYQLGYDFNLEGGASERLLANRSRIDDYALFTSLEYHPSIRWTIRPGLRIAHNTRYQAPFIPSLNLKYQHNEALAVRLSYARGFRAPALKELYLYFVDVNHNVQGNPNLKPEFSHNINAHLSYRKNYKKSLIYIEPSFFYNRIQNLIQLALRSLTTNLYTYVNIGVMETHGLQGLIKLRHDKLNVEAGGAYIGRANGVTSVGHFFYTPEVTFNASYSHKQYTTALFAKFNGRVQGFMTDVNGENQPMFIAPFTILDANISRRFWKNRLQATIGVRNLLNVMTIAATSPGGAHNTGSTAMPMGMGRTAFFRLQFLLD